MTSMTGHGNSGFTLMELLVAMTLLGMLMAALFGGLRLGTRVWEASDRAVQQSNGAEMVRSFLQARFERILPLSGTLSGGDEEALFRGDQRSLRFVSFMPESFGQQPFLMELSLQRRDQAVLRDDLVLKWRRLEEALADAGDVTAGQRVLMEDVADIAFGYFGGDRRQARSWSDQWRNREALPALIRVELAFPGGDLRRWHPLMVSPMIDEWYNAGD